MRKNRTSIFLLICILLLGIVSSHVYVTYLYDEYQQQWEYRRMKPEILPSSQVMQLLAVGHETTYADMIWIQLIQFIGDNIRGSRYLEFTHDILTRIHVLHPRFARAYEFDILFLPSTSIRDENSLTEHKKKILGEGLNYYESILPKICNMKKLDEIDRAPFGVELWEREDLKNPCISGYIPYYLASKYDTELLDKLRASYYYKIASMHDDAPRASRYLGILAFSSDGNYRDGALSFALIGAELYDEPPYKCQELALSITRDLSENVPWTDTWIRDLMEKEASLEMPKDTTNPMSLNAHCYDMLARGIKQIYIGYITQISTDIPDVSTIEELMTLRRIDYIPRIQSQKDFTMVKKDNIWRYIQKIDE